MIINPTEFQTKPSGDSYPLEAEEPSVSDDKIIKQVRISDNWHSWGRNVKEEDNLDSKLKCLQHTFTLPACLSF